MKTGTRRVLTGLAIALASSAATFLLIEAGMRLATGRKFLDEDLRLQTGEIAYKPNQAQRWKRLEWDIDMRVNSKGLRDYEHPPEPSPGSILVLGDSFTEGYGVELAETYSKRLEQRLKAAGTPRRVYNAGLRGRTPKDYFRVYDAFFRDDPGVSLVIMGFFIAKDIAGPATDAGTELAQAPDQTRWTYEAKRFLCEHSVLYNLVRRAVKSAPDNKRYNQLVKWGFVQSLGEGQDRHPWASRKHLDKWKHTAGLLAAFRDRLQAQGRRFVLVLIPTKNQVEDDSYETFLQATGVDPKAMERFAFAEFMTGYGREKGIPVLDLTPAFREANAREPGAFFFKTDGHWSPRGHALAEERLHAFLKEKGYLKPR